MLAELFKKGNHKLPKRYLIYNAGAAKDCPSRALGLCQCPGDCYAARSETRNKRAIPKRRLQEAATRIYTPAEAAETVEGIVCRAINPVTTLRINEAGDFRDARQLGWFAELAELVAGVVGVYAYTARTDLDLTRLLAASSIVVSNDEGGWQARGAIRFKVVDEIPSDWTGLVCSTDCDTCTHCLNAKGQTILALRH